SSRWSIPTRNAWSGDVADIHRDRLAFHQGRRRPLDARDARLPERNPRHRQDHAGGRKGRSVLSPRLEPDRQVVGVLWLATGGATAGTRHPAHAVWRAAGMGRPAAAGTPRPAIAEPGPGAG